MRPCRSGLSPRAALLGALLLALPAGADEDGKREATSAVSQPIREALIEKLVTRHGAGERERIRRGVSQAAALWREQDGDLGAFAEEHFLPASSAALAATQARLEAAFEALDGHENEIGRELRRATDLDVGPLLPTDSLLAAFDAGAHLGEDLFASKIAFVALLNFPLTTLQERLDAGARWDRKAWAAVRLAGRFARRVPGEVQQAISSAASEAELYIAQYNIWMHHLLSERGERLFPRGLRLISHWNLRDELKADYADPRGLDKQRTILKVMERIVTQSIPAAVIDNPTVDWNPFSNLVTACPAGEVDGAPGRPDRRDLGASPAAEADVRYRRLLSQFHAQRRADPHSPTAPTYLQRSFELSREIPEERVRRLLLEVLTSKLAPRVAKAIAKRLGRSLEPQDIWYNGFQARGRFSDEQLDGKVGERYPTAEAFARDIPRILVALGFAPDKADFLAAHIVVDPSRGAGHALPALRRGDFPHLRTRVEARGMNYKGYNIAVHELGHNVEQVFSLYGVDHTLLQGVPSNAFTEALAFVFQARDLELLGLARPDAESELMRVLNDFWQTFEIAGVGLVDIAVWHWLYDHPAATAAELREAVAKIAREHWNRYYAPLLDGRDTPLLGIYSHMVSYPLYLCDYPLGRLIAFQIEEQMRRAGTIGPEFERMARQGSVTPDLWMQGATGAPVGAGPLLRATAKALDGH